MRRITKKRLAAITAAPNLGRWPCRDPIPLTLFDAPAVTQADVDRWLLAVPKIDPASPRAARYVAAYNVPAKIAAAKACGQFERILDGRQARALALWPEQ